MHIQEMSRIHGCPCFLPFSLHRERLGWRSGLHLSDRAGMVCGLFGRYTVILNEAAFGRKACYGLVLGWQTLNRLLQNSSGYLLSFKCQEVEI